ncbi:hypothetical protein DMN91_003151 [Ooceraea biroi]|uniref:Protein croquemort n=1 Tax=Ooceraea biroi TaxID=2015173 RepID=A0A026X443_OOCBI|nr:protein croquemort [Ooceraea biroi]EZA62873.1 Protein croquemort [Ooceraea biroi]RLU25059.1 hypothetical protein DMN91_003151 [Ooceraea biroi]
MRPTTKTLSLGVIGLLLVALGISLCFLSPTIFRQILQKGLALSPTSKSFDVWKDTSSLPPMFMQVYFFNWTNPEELEVPGKKPRFVQVGPYCFREIRQKDNIKFNHENKTVSYLQRRLWYFEAELSNGSLNDVITCPDPVASSAAYKIRDWELEWQATLSLVLGSSDRSIHIHKTVDELTFTGYSDSLFTMGKMMASDDVPPYDRFAWFYMRNGTTDLDGHFNMETGEDDISQLGILRKWNYNDAIKFYKSPCNIVEGSAGEFWPPDRTKDDITLFSTELCRPIVYEYEKTVSYLGVEGYRYIMDKKTLGNATKRRYPHEQAKFFEKTTTTEDFFAAEHSVEAVGFTTTTQSSFNSMPENESSENTDEYRDGDPDVVNMGNCYCNGECVPSGLLNVSTCRFGAPVFVSLPHFHRSDPSILDQIEGLNPNDGDYDFAITLEPTTGIPLQVTAQLQVNILLQPSKYVSLYKNVPKIYMPMLWLNLKVGVSEEMAAKLKQLLALPTVMLCGGITIAIVGLCLIGAVVLLYIWRKQPILPKISAEQKQLNDPPEKKTEMVYMDKISSNEDGNARSDRRLYAKP